MKGRPLLTFTVEKFHPDDRGSTYFSIDVNYTSEGIASAYWEIARELKFWKGLFFVHPEYSGGLAEGLSYNNVYLAGTIYTYNSASFSGGFTLTTMYRYVQKHPFPNNLQLTGTRYMNFCKGLLALSGSADWWREGTKYGKTIFLSEPQFWVSLSRIKGVNKNFNLSVSSEVELNNNFGGRDDSYVIPTLVSKWTLD